MSALFWRDLKLTMGAGGGFGQGLGFFLVVIFLFVLALGADSPLLREIGAEVFYVAALLSGLLSLERMFRVDVRDGTMAQLRLSPVPIELIVATKALVHWLTTGFALTVIAPVIGILLGMPMAEVGILMLTLLIGTPALSLFGAIGAALTVSIERSSLIQALITLPLFIPTLIYGTMANTTDARQFAALSFLAGLTLIAAVFAPWVSGYILRRHQN